MGLKGFVFKAWALMLLVLGLGNAQAVNLGANGVGQVLIVPYYNVENGNETIFSVTNATDQAKAVKVTIREADNGQVVLGFHLYLSPFDVWSARISDDGNNGAQLSTYDNSCTVPSFTPGQGVGFRTFAYQGDGGDTSVARTREGFIEIMEMAEVEPGSDAALAMLHDASGVPADCESLKSNWLPGGTWYADPAVSMTAPAGGLKGAGSIINVGAGIEYELPVTALDNFTSVVQHAAPGADLPNLTSATPVSTVLLASNASLPVYNDQWNSNRGIDAVSAVLMKQALLGGFSVNPAADTETDWVVVFPTKYFYTQGNAVAPFTSVFGANGACETVSITAWDREEQAGANTSDDLCYVVNVINFKTSNILHAVRNKSSFDPGVSNGWARIGFSQSMSTPNGFVYTGLPAIGFAVKRSGNSFVGIPYSNVASLNSLPIRGSQRVFLSAGQSAVSSIDGYDDEVTFVSTEKIFTQGNLPIGPGKKITFMAPLVILNKGFSVGDRGMFRVVSTN